MTTQKASSDQSASAVFPGGRIGMLGGGQLGRMFGVAARQLGFRFSVYDPATDAPAAAVADRVVSRPWNDYQALREFAQSCDVLTLEFENIPADSLQCCEEVTPTYPGVFALSVAQDRNREKSTLRDSGLPVTPFEAADSLQSLREKVNHRWDGQRFVIKTTRSGYDGKGQWLISESGEIPDDVPGDQPLVAERWITHLAEVSVVVARGRNGETATFPVFENEHRNHILHITRCPSKIDAAVQTEAEGIAVRAAETLQLVGLLCVEFFVLEEAAREEFGSSVLINEVAPRPHNSGHLTIEACQTSQFQQHVRAVCGLPLGSTRLVRPAAMLNLLGDRWETDPQPWIDSVLRCPSASLHLYGKSAARPGRKMGHITVVDDSVDAAIQQARSFE